MRTAYPHPVVRRIPARALSHGAPFAFDRLTDVVSKSRRDVFTTLRRFWSKPANRSINRFRGLSLLGIG